jgi:hypothetical protein
MVNSHIVEVTVERKDEQSWKRQAEIDGENKLIGVNSASGLIMGLKLLQNANM